MKNIEESTGVAQIPSVNTFTNEDLTDKPKTPPVTYKHNYDLEVGKKDCNGYLIEEIYACEKGKYCIYHTPKYSIQIIAENEALMSGNVKMNKFFMMVSDYFSSDLDLRKKYLSNMAYAVKTFYDGNPDSACDALNLTHNYILRYLKRKAAIAYLMGAFGMVLIVLITHFTLYRMDTLDVMGNILFCAATFSSLGGLLSVSTSSGKIKIDVQNNFYIKAFYGSTRIIIAIISGVITYFLINSKLLFAFIETSNNIHAFYVAFFIAGFCEKLIPNMMLDFDRKESSRSIKPDSSNS